jgi:hypothetical protein
VLYVGIEAEDHKEICNLEIEELTN